MFRYQDNNNYYRFSMDRTLSQRRLVKKVNGSYTLLHQDTIRYSLNTTYRISVTVVGNSISVSLNGQPFYSGTDSSVSAGSVGFYCWRNSGATFDNVTVVPAMSMAQLRRDVSFEPILLAEDIARLEAGGWRLEPDAEWLKQDAREPGSALSALLLNDSPPPWSGGRSMHPCIRAICASMHIRGLGWGQPSLTKGTTEQQGSLR